MLTLMDVNSIVDEIDTELRSHAAPGRAEKERAYLKSALEHYGVSLPAIRGVAKRVRTAHPALDHEGLLAVVHGLWEVPVHERRVTASILLGLYGDRLEAADMKTLESLLRQSKTWALIDILAASVVGPLVERDPRAADVLDRWAADGDFWIRRSALLALLLALRRGEGDFERFSRYADPLLEDKEFFVRKAIGWVLRDTARRRPDLVFDWLLPRAVRASGVTVREAIKPMTAVQREAILAAR
jgi:3-methyladenine DNA glycosylase AlkD